MDARQLGPMLVGGMLAALLLPTPTSSQDHAANQSSIEREIVARYRSFEGPAAEQTWAKWEDYFLRSPSIGNLHGSNMELGWESYRDGSLRYFQRPPAQRAAVRFDDLEVFVVDERTAWVRGVFVNIIGEQEMRPQFYDMLLKTDDGWRVFFSYVAPPR